MASRLGHTPACRWLIVFGVAALAAFQWSQAKVFQRWRSRGRVAETLEILGGKAAYRADMLVNGAEAELMIYSMPESISRTVPELRRALAVESFDYAGGSLARADVLGKKSALRLIAMQVSAADQTLVLAISQTREAYERSRQAPAAHPIRDLPDYPEATVLFHAENKDTHTQIATFQTPDAEVAATTFYQTALRGSGWLPAIPEPQHGQPGMLFYLKGNQICLVSTCGDPATASTTITVLHKTVTGTKQVAQ